MKRNAVLLSALLLCLLLPCMVAIGQNQPATHKHVVQFSGQVVAGDSLIVLEGVAVYVPGTTRGTHTRKSGYFSLPVVAGDTVVFATLGYEKLYLTVPANTNESNLTLSIRLTEKSTTLPTVEVMPWATEYDLKQAILRTKLPEEPSERLPVIPPPVAYRSIKDMPAMDASQNFKYGQQQQQSLRDARIRVPDILKVTSVPIKYY
ncbi:carboxypeptidase-like regulatory domain-containing protein [uncultured Pontibacter sp.]|uniref:carboxypeptidase-like regulatory domain-containing protein n=1 Tax=uncultured Pontibacter sp. TaxID=453356 RepID=UPI00261DE6C1|nr:carboxypeptidase-like regulatory domain-containing protein [uncultured Pontibacter sp.]